jgi:hypothetical protein
MAETGSELEKAQQVNAGPRREETNGKGTQDSRLRGLRISWYGCGGVSGLDEEKEERGRALNSDCTVINPILG